VLVGFPTSPHPLCTPSTSNFDSFLNHFHYYSPLFRFVFRASSLPRPAPLSAFLSVAVSPQAPTPQLYHIVQEKFPPPIVPPRNVPPFLLTALAFLLTTFENLPDPIFATASCELFFPFLCLFPLCDPYPPPTHTNIGVSGVCEVWHQTARKASARRVRMTVLDRAPSAFAGPLSLQYSPVAHR